MKEPYETSEALEQFMIDCRRFPEIPENIQEETLIFLLRQMELQPLNSQRNFLMHLMHSVDSFTYELFLELWKEDAEDQFFKIVPQC
jgi:hypothetical protein